MNTRRSRRALALGLALTAALAGGCGAFKGASDDGDSAGPTITVDVFAGGFTVPENDAIKPVIDSKLGVNLQLRPTASGAEYYNKLSASLAGGSTGDLFQVDRPHLAQLVAQGLVMDMGPSLESGKLDAYKKWVPTDARRIATVNGKVYGLAAKPQDGPYGSYWIRKDWLDKLKLKAPTTTEEFEKVALAFTKDDPDGNGKADTFGIVGQGVRTFSSLFTAFGSGGPGSFYVKEGAVVNGYADPDTKNALGYVRGLFEQGVVAPDTLTLTQPKAIEFAAQGKAGIISADFSQMATAAADIKKAQPDAEWVQLSPPEGPAGQGVVFDVASTKVLAIPAGLDAAKLDKVLELINYLSGDEGVDLVSFGIKDIDWTMVDGKPKLTDEALKKTTDERGFSWLYQLVGRSDSAYLKRGGAGYTDAQVEFALGQPRFKIYDSLASSPEGYNSADADRFADTTIVQFLTGESALDGYDDFLSTLLGKFHYQTYIDSTVRELKSLGVGAG